MDEIYAKAQLTIIAAAGNDPSYGLPGVGSRSRSSERHVCIGKTKLVQLMRPGSDFPKSSWWKRAWTYQEGVLSQRKLVFTDHQVYYVCNRLSTAESLKIHSANAFRWAFAPLVDPVSFKEMITWFTSERRVQASGAPHQLCAPLRAYTSTTLQYNI
jgi:hypothetical protein